MSDAPAERRSRTFRTDAIILRRRNFAEADRLLTVLTPQRGRLDLFAKGARRPSSAKTGHVELFTRSERLVHRGRELGRAVQAELRKPWQALHEDLQRSAWAGHVAELVERFTNPGDDDLRAVFELLDATFGRLCDEPDARLVVRHFELKLLDETGFRPELQSCVLGDEVIVAEDQYFSHAAGGVVCPRCAGRGLGQLPLAEATLRVLRHLQRSPWGQLRGLRVPEALHNDIERVLTGYITWVLERRLQGMDFARRVRQLQTLQDVAENRSRKP